MSGELPSVEAELPYGFESDDKPQDQCGVYGIFAPGLPVNYYAYRGLSDLQHRGQSGAGIAYQDGGSQSGLFVHKGRGKIDEAIGIEVGPRNDGTSIADIISNSPLAIGHTRYSTAECEEIDAMHPHVGHQTGIALAHNGDIEYMSEIASTYGIEATDGDTDSSLLTKVIDQVSSQYGASGLDHALAEVLPQIGGAYCLTITDGKRVIAVRDPWGIHPLALGELPGGKGYVVASEPVAFKKSGAISVRDVEPGEILSIDETGLKSSRIDRIEPVRNCLFEYIYTARPDSIINGASVYRARKNMGVNLAEDHPADADVVVGVPNSGLAAAAGYALASGLPQVEGIFKNQYIGRTYLLRGDERKAELDEKFHPNAEELAGQRIVLVDDSLIKGHTMTTLIGMLRAAGAREVHVRLAAPHYKYPCYGGMDTRETWRLIARNHSDAEITKMIGADSVRFNHLERVVEAIDNARVDPQSARLFGTFCTACVTGDYPYPVPSTTELPIPRRRYQDALPVA